MFKKKVSFHTKPDSELVAAVREGDTAAFDELYLRWYPQVKRFLQALLQDPHLANDLAQSIFMKIWLFRNRLQPSLSLKNYLFVMARNAALDVFKSKRLLITDVTEVDKVGDDTANMRAEFNETMSQLRRVVDDMPPQRKEVFKMSREQNMSNDQIASVLGLSVRTVEKHLQLALRDIRKNLN